MEGSSRCSKQLIYFLLELLFDTTFHDGFPNQREGWHQPCWISKIQKGLGLATEIQSRWCQKTKAGPEPKMQKAGNWQARMSLLKTTVTCKMDGEGRLVNKVQCKQQKLKMVDKLQVK